MVFTPAPARSLISTKSLPPRALTVTCSTLSVSITMLPTLRVNSSRPPLSLAVNVSFPPAPLNVIRSRPRRPSMMSLPSPGSQMNSSSREPSAGGVVAAVAVDDVVAVAGLEVLGAGATEQHVVTGLAVDRRRQRVGERHGGAGGLVDEHEIVAIASADVDAVDVGALERELGDPVVAQVDVDRRRSGGRRAQGEDVVAGSAEHEQRARLDAGV